jgi:hypothetical protein
MAYRMSVGVFSRAWEAVRTNLLEHIVLFFLGHGEGIAIAQKTCNYGMLDRVASCWVSRARR